MSLLGDLHQRIVLPRRALRLAELLAAMIPANSRVLDVGSGDGNVAGLLMERRSDLSIEGVDSLVRRQTHISVRHFDGKSLPYVDSSFDVVMLIDVLHHTTDPIVLMREAVRVSRKDVLIKDHLRQGMLAAERLRFMDYVGNARFGVALPFNYWTPEQWDTAAHLLGLRKVAEQMDLKLYPRPLNYVFGAGLHFIAKYEIATTK
jgi:ubiquinone/menaquinone biosynthesis C-methylase UbiE